MYSLNSFHNNYNYAILYVLMKTAKLFLKFSFCFSLFFLFSFPVYSQDLNPQKWGSPCVANVNGVEVATLQGFECLFANIVKIIIPVAGLALFLTIIVGAFQLITAGGEQKPLQKAKATLTYAAFGFVALIGIWFILLLIKEITGVDVTTFEMPK